MKSWVDKQLEDPKVLRAAYDYASDELIKSLDERDRLRAATKAALLLLTSRFAKDKSRAREKVVAKLNAALWKGAGYG